MSKTIKAEITSVSITGRNSNAGDEYDVSLYATFPTFEEANEFLQTNVGLVKTSGKKRA